MTPSDPNDRPARPGPSLIVHTGAWDVPLLEREAHRAACLIAVRAGWDVLRGGGRAVDAVQTAILAMEDWEGELENGSTSWAWRPDWEPTRHVQVP